jgi:predicted Co/Zn/Cd cation transporter (cation efflux family)
MREQVNIRVIVGHVIAYPIGIFAVGHMFYAAILDCGYGVCPQLGALYLSVALLAGLGIVLGLILGHRFHRRGQTIASAREGGIWGSLLGVGAAILFTFVFVLWIPDAQLDVLVSYVLPIIVLYSAFVWVVRRRFLRL